MQYAPVIIPTLNRYEHFKRCLDSLERCSGADRTRVYVGLDYPPSEKYVEGWKKIDEYLKEKERSNGFEELIVERRDHNCGVIGVGCNFSLLFNRAMETTDRLIASEDDNEFAPSFLEFMNKSLDRYQNDDRITSVCGYSRPAYNKSDVILNQVFVQDNCAWGLGYWKGKEIVLNRYNKEWCETVLTTTENVCKLMHCYPMLVSMMINMLRKGIVYGDARRTCANIINDTLQVRPKISLVRNWGNDGSGINCNKISEVSSEAIDTSEHFELSECNVERTGELDAVMYDILLPKYFPLKQMKIIKIWFKYLCYRFFR